MGAQRQPEGVSERRSGRQLQSRSTNERSRRVDGADAFLAPVVPGQTRFGVVRSPSSLQMFVPALRTPPLACCVREEEVKTLLRGACSLDGWLDQQLAVANPKKLSPENPDGRAQRGPHGRGQTTPVNKGLNRARIPRTVASRTPTAYEVRVRYCSGRTKQSTVRYTRTRSVSYCVLVLYIPRTRNG